MGAGDVLALGILCDLEFSLAEDVIPKRRLATEIGQSRADLVVIDGETGKHRRVMHRSVVRGTVPF